MTLASTSDDPTAACSIRDLIHSIEARQGDVQKAMRGPEIRRSPRREAARSFVLGSILHRLDTLSRLLRENSETVNPCLRDHLKQLLDRVKKVVDDAETESSSSSASKWRLSNVVARFASKSPFMKHSRREAAWELVHELDCALLEVGDARYLLGRLDQERRFDSDPANEYRWSVLYDSSQLHQLYSLLETDQSAIGASPESERNLRNEIVEMLARLCEKRSDADRDYRAQETLRVIRLRWTCWFLGAALLAAMMLYSFVLFDRWQDGVLAMGLALASAALGGTLSRIRTLRDEPLVSRSGEQPRYRTAFVAQLLVSGSLGLILLTMAALDILPGLMSVQSPQNPNPTLAQFLLDEQNLLILSLYAFGAGFSEPPTINILQRSLPGGGAI